MRSTAKFFSLFIVIVSLQSFAVVEADLGKCEKNSDCVIVPYSHCCGSTKRAINKKYLKDYEKRPSWQKFDESSTCATIGICASDENVKKTKCEAGQCQLVR